jgi:hypothetical protein
MVRTSYIYLNEYFYHVFLISNVHVVFNRLLFFSETSLQKKTKLAALLYKTSKDAKKLIGKKESQMDLMRMKIVSLLHAGRENIARLKVYYIYLSIYSCIFSTRSRMAYFVKLFSYLCR